MYKFETSNVVFYGLSRDGNGNKTAQFSVGDGRKFSIQTNGNIPAVHSMDKGDEFTAEMEKQVNYYIKNYGTKSQKEALCMP